MKVTTVEEANLKGETTEILIEEEIPLTREEKVSVAEECLEEKTPKKKLFRRGK